MARTLIALIPICLLALGASCQTAEQRLTQAATAQATTQALAKSLPSRLADSCTAQMPAALPSMGEPWVVLQQRWQMLRANRNDQARDCAQWWADYRGALGR